MSEEEKPPTDAERFANMAERIEHNKESTFGGAFVIVIPGGLVAPLESLILDTQGDPAQFLMLLQAKIAQIMEDLKTRERQFGR